MMGMIEGMGWMAVSLGLVSLLVIRLLVVGIAALVKHVRR